MNNASNIRTRFHVYDLNDRLCGVWYAISEVQAITLAIREGYDAWSAQEPTCTGW